MYTIHPLMDIQAVFTFQLLIVLLCIYMHFFEYMFSVFGGIYLVVELLGHMVILSKVLWTAKLFFTWLKHFTFSPAISEGSDTSTSTSTLVILYFFFFCVCVYVEIDKPIVKFCANSNSQGNLEEGHGCGSYTTKLL